MATGVCVGRNIRKDIRHRGSRGLFTAFTFGISLALLLSGGDAEGATLQDLDNQLGVLESAVDADTLQGLAIIDAIQVVIAPPQSLTAGTVGGSPVVDLPVHYRASTVPVSSIQFDVVLSTGLSVVSVSPGLAAQASGKSVQGNPVPVGHRVLVFGLNQTAIPSGPVAILRLNSGENVGKKPVSLTNIAASSPSGTSVPVTGRPGSVTVQ